MLWGQRHPLYFSNGHAIMKYSKNRKLAKDLLRWMHKDENLNFEQWFQVCEGYSVVAPPRGVADMFATAVHGMEPEDAVKRAVGELKKIYEA